MKPVRYSYGITAALLASGAAISLITGVPAGAQDAQDTRLRPSRSAPLAPTGFADLAEVLIPAVVNISTRQSISLDRDNREGAPRAEGGSAGSGFLISADGYVVTNNHVLHPDVRARLQSVTVTLSDGTEYEAELVGTDPQSDLAVLKIARAQPFPFVRFGDSGRARVGDWVIAIGNPFGLDGTVTSGIISALNRSTGNRGAFDRNIQTDASINSGNSGGPLFGMNGRVLGINTFILSPGEAGGNVGIGFAIPAADAIPIVRQLISGEQIQRGYLGVSIVAVSDDYAEALGMPQNSGELIQSVVAGEAGDDAGLRAGDVVTKVNGEPITRERSLSFIVANIPPGRRVPMEYIRDGQRLSTTAVVGLRPSEDDLRAATQTFDADPEGAGRMDPANTSGLIERALRVQVTAITPQIARQLGTGPETTGILVLAVDATADAARKGLARGIIIHAANNRPVTTPAELEAQIRAVQSEGREAILLRISAPGQAERLIPVRLRAE